MPVNLNLLPPELSVSKNLGSLLKTLRALGVIAIGAFLVFGTGIGAFFIVSRMTLENLNVKLNALKSQVSAQEKSEQQVVLLKDRLAKITTIRGMPSSLINLTVMEPFLAGFSSNVSINQMEVGTKGIDLALNIKTNSDLSAFLTSIKDSGVFKSVDLTSFAFSPSTGYSVGVTMVKK